MNLNVCKNLNFEFHGICDSFRHTFLPDLYPQPYAHNIKLLDHIIHTMDLQVLEVLDNLSFRHARMYPSMCCVSKNVYSGETSMCERD